MEISYSPTNGTPKIHIPGSKSIANRMLVIKSLYWPELELYNIPSSDDTVLLQKAIDALRGNGTRKALEAGDGGTTFRFLTALLVGLNRPGAVHASYQLLGRPNTALNDALNSAGFKVTFDSTKGNSIQPIDLSKVASTWNVDSSKSSQFASALALIAPSMPKPIEIRLSEQSVSMAYLNMTLKLMHSNGIDIHRDGLCIYANPFVRKSIPKSYTIESDWSGLSYFASAALLTKTVIHIYNVSNSFLQPDQNILSFFEAFGGTYTYTEDILMLDGRNCIAPSNIERDYTNCPDLYPAEKVACFALGATLLAHGTEHIQHKESDRVAVLDIELKKWQDEVPMFNSHDDHRIAMSLAVLAAIKPINIQKPHVVSKSFPDFWQQLSKLGYSFHGKQ